MSKLGRCHQCKGRGEIFKALPTNPHQGAYATCTHCLGSGSVEVEEQAQQASMFPQDPDSYYRAERLDNVQSDDI